MPQEAVQTLAQSVHQRVCALLPRGLPLPDDVWTQRHRAILSLFWIHALGIYAFVLASPNIDGHRILEGSILPAIAVLASGMRGKRARSGLTSLGLISSSAMLVHVSGGYIEMHFHFFIMIAVIAFYQDWVPFLLAVGFVVLHHGVFGILDPVAVYNHPDAWEHPWKWAAIHGGFVLTACAASVMNWRLSEGARAHSEQAEQEVRALNSQLESRVMERTASLAKAVGQLREQAARRERAEAELARLSARQELDRITRDFVSTASHEFRTPLTALTGFTELLLAQELASNQQRTWIETMHRESMRLSHLVEELLDLTRIEDGRIDLKLEQTGIQLLIDEVLSSFAAAEATHDFESLSVATHIHVSADREKLVQILTNLLSNAVKYSPDGGTISISATEEGELARITIADQGVGISTAEMSALFGRFNRVASHSDRGIKGSGLGLFITKRLVELHGGTIMAESLGTGKGSTFSFTLPLVRVAVPV